MPRDHGVDPLLADGLEQPLRTMRDWIENHVHAQYKLMFGEDPSPEELDRWAEFVVKAGSKLQRRKGLTPAGAGGECVPVSAGGSNARPSVHNIQDVQENTELRDRMVAAAQAARMIAEAY